MFKSDPEPGYYEDGNFGIRIENVMEVVKADTEVPHSPAPPAVTSAVQLR